MTDIVINREISTSPEVLFEFLVHADKLVQWLGVSARIDATPGGEFLVKITDGDTAVGSYVEVVPHHRCVFTWGWAESADVPPGSSTVAIDLERTPGGTRLTLTHSGLPTDTAPGHRAGWTYFLDRFTNAGTGIANPPVDVSPIQEDS